MTGQMRSGASDGGSGDIAMFSTPDDDGEQHRSPSSEEQVARSQRVLACRLCQQRKVKCDRRFPCVNCIKSRSQCIPATQAPRRKRRRLPERDLLDRLNKYESLLRQHNIDFDHIKDESTVIEVASAQEPGSREPSASTATTLGDKPFDGINLFKAMSNLRLGESSEGELDETSMERTWDAAYANSTDMLFGSQKAFIDLSTLQPDVVHIFRLWQIYLDNVNPMLKVTHTPTLQERIMRAASNLVDIEPGLEALMFGIYAMAIMSSTDQFCQQTFGFSKKDLLTRFSFGCEQALMKADFMKGSSRECLTALLFYLLAAWPRDPRPLSALVSIAVRLGFRLGLHSETINQTHNVLEAELRRRLWWALLLFEVRMSQLARDKTTSMLPIWDCKIPSNLDDSELREDLTELPTCRNAPTEASYIVLRCEIADYVRFSNFFLNMNNPALKVFAKSPVPEGDDEMDHIERVVNEKYVSQYNEQNPLQAMNIWTTQQHLGRFRLSEFLIRLAQEGARPSDEKRDIYLGHALTALEADTKICTSPITQGFKWTASFIFPFPAYYHVLQELRRRPGLSNNHHAWNVIEENLAARMNTEGMDPIALYTVLGKMVVHAWKSYDALHTRQGLMLTTPPCIARLRDYSMADSIQTPGFEATMADNTLDHSSSNTSQPTFDLLPEQPSASVDAVDMIWPAMSFDAMGFPSQWTSTDQASGNQFRW